MIFTLKPCMWHKSSVRDMVVDSVRNYLMTPGWYSRFVVGMDSR